MAVNAPNISAYIESACSHPFLLGNIDLLLEDFIARNCIDTIVTSACEETNKQEDGSKEAADSEKPNSSNLIDMLIKSARDALEMIGDNTSPTTADTNQSETPQPQESHTTTEGISEESTPQELIIPIRNKTTLEYEWTFNFEGCASDSIKLEFNDGILSVTGKKENEDGIKTISYEKKLPSDVDSSTLKGTFLEDGTLKIAGNIYGVLKTSDDQLEIGRS